MPIVIVPAGLRSQQVEIPSGIERSREGAVHFRPAHTVDLTVGELEFLRNKHQALFAQLLVVESRPARTRKKDSDVAGGATSHARKRAHKSTPKKAPAEAQPTDPPIGQPTPDPADS